ncbi:MAG: Fe-S cluster assembly protein SufD [Anaerolineaceae bacterium]|nr:Fe-S cluster assembly protein SufD [Anaerolineaceae bacterium]
MEKNVRVIKTNKASGKTNQKDFAFPDTLIRTPENNTNVAEIRKNAADQFKNGSIPEKHEEAWRRTSLALIDFSKFSMQSAQQSDVNINIPDQLMNPMGEGEQAGQIILSHNYIKKNISSELVAKGVIFTDLLDAEKNYPEILAKIFCQIVKPEDGYFSALATAYAQTGILLYVPRNTHIEQPLHSILWAEKANEAVISHIMVYLEEGASLTYVHEVSSPNDMDEEIFHSGNIEIFVGNHANIKFVELQSWGKNVLNFTHERGSVAGDGELEWVFGAIGSKLSKNFTDVDLTGIGSIGKVSGFYFTNGNQHLDLDTQQNHLAANTSSDLLYKGALLDQSRSVWQGMIYVAPGAMKTDGYQANRNLVLGKEARADAIPGLEILADDVRCSHGATVGRIDSSQTFYLESRGIPKLEAAKLVVEGFFDEIMQRIPFDGIRQRFQDAIHEKMSTFHL